MSKFKVGDIVKVASCCVGTQVDEVGQITDIRPNGMHYVLNKSGSRSTAFGHFGTCLRIATEQEARAYRRAERKAGRQVIKPTKSEERKSKYRYPVSRETAKVGMQVLVKCDKGSGQNGKIGTIADILSYDSGDPVKVQIGAGDDWWWHNWPCIFSSKRPPRAERTKVAGSKTDEVRIGDRVQMINTGCCGCGTGSRADDKGVVERYRSGDNLPYTIRLDRTGSTWYHKRECFRRLPGTKGKM